MTIYLSILFLMTILVKIIVNPMASMCKKNSKEIDCFEINFFA